MPTGVKSSLGPANMNPSNSSIHPAESAASKPCEAPSLKGLEHAGVIDLLGFHPSSGEVLLTMVETRPWTDGSPQLYQLQEKLNAYLSFILDGEMLEAYPQFACKPVRVRLECAAPPGPAEMAFLQHVHEQTELQGIAFEVDVVGTACGDCGCTP